MLHKETVSLGLFATLKALFSIPELSSFKLVGGTAIALQIGHRRSVDIDLFSNEETDKAKIKQILSEKFSVADVTLTQDNLLTEIGGVRVELYDRWMVPFRKIPVTEEGLRLAALNDLAAFKLNAITGRREKKDYIDLFFLFRKLGDQYVLSEFQKYDPLLSPKSILFALSEVKAAQENKSPMPDMITAVSWKEITQMMLKAAENYLHVIEKQSRKPK